MASTYDIERQSYLTPHVSDSPNHWSDSEEWLALQKARAASTKRLSAGNPVYRGQVHVEDTPEVREALAAFEKAFPTQEPEVPVVQMTPRQLEIEAAKIDLRRAVERLRPYTHPDRLVRLVSDMLSA
jgi:hypothetical protein